VVPDDAGRLQLDLELVGDDVTVTNRYESATARFDRIDQPE
jgi:hypothetical protein